MSLRKLAFDTAAMSAVNMMRLLAQFLAIPLLARLLSPADYGVVAIAMPFVFFSMVIADAGIGMSLVRAPASDRGLWSTCFWLSVMLGLALTLIMVASAPLAAIVFDEPSLEPIIMVLSLVVLIQAAGAIPLASLQQQHRFKVIAGTEMTGMVAGIIAAVTVALKGGGAWALVFQQLALYVVRIGLVFWYAPFRPTMHFALQNIKEHLHFGRDVLGVNIAGLVSRSADNLIIGKILDSAAVGVYSMAFQFARLPAMLVAGPLQYVVYSKLALVKDDTSAIRATFLLLTRILAIIVFPSVGMAAAAHQPLFLLLLSEKWAASGKLFMMAAPACALQAVTALSGTIMLVRGRTDVRLRITLEFAMLWMAVLLIAAPFGLEWAAMAFNAAVFAYSIRNMMLVLPFIECKVMAYWRILLTPVVVMLACVAMYETLLNAIDMGMWFKLCIAAALALAGIAASGLLQKKVLQLEVRLLKS